MALVTSRQYMALCTWRSHRYLVSRQNLIHAKLTVGFYEVWVQVVFIMGLWRLVLHTSPVNQRLSQASGQTSPTKITKCCNS